MTRLRAALLFPVALVFLLPSWTGPAAAGSRASCESLAAASLPNTTIDQVQAITAGSFTPAGAPTAITDLPPFCRVAGVIAPANDSHIRFEVWLPLDTWNGKFAGVGNGGFAGSISYRALATQIRRGYASGSTDTGHPAQPGLDGAKFGFGHPEKRIDFGHRAVHEMTVAGKSLTRAFYERDPRHSYWIGCSEGGRQGLMEAQRFPLDYDGIVAGAPANNLTRLAAGQLNALLAMSAEAGSYLPATVTALLHRGVLDACDALDGVTDGVLENPRRCDFDPAELECPGGQVDACLTSAQVRAARRVYAGVQDPRTGAPIYPGLPLGSEPGWSRPLNPDRPFTIPASNFRWLVMGDSTWDWRTFDFSRPSDFQAFLVFDESYGAVSRAFNPDLRPFRSRGGKLLQYHGWSDPLISAANSVDYFETMVFQMAGGMDQPAAVESVQEFYRLFMAPGMAHCRGGDGPNQFDMQAVLEEWVEQGRAPESVIATRRTDGRDDRSRPLCPYPQVAVYRGEGSTDEAANFSCAEQ